MNVNHASTYISVLDYLDGEKISDVKHEYINGEVYAMAGASRSHNILTGNVWSAFMAHLDGTRCISFSSDMKVNIDNQFFYPDVLVTCDDDLGDDYYTKAPIILVEVLSKSTRKMDKSFKLAAYKTIPSLLEYVLIEQEFAEIEICRRYSHWSSTHYFLGDDVHFESIDLTLSVEAIYRRVQNQDVIDYLQAQT
jgi:Uma2 family endonuclease